MKFHRNVAALLWKDFEWMLRHDSVFLGDISSRCPEAKISSWAWLQNHVSGKSANLVVFVMGWLRFHKTKSIKVLAGSLKHAKGGRHCFFLQWSWTFSYWNSTLYCCELLHFWLVSFFCWYSLLPLVMEDTIAVSPVNMGCTSLNYQGEEVFAREVPEQARDILSNSSGVSHVCYTHMLSFRYHKKTNADEGYTLQDSPWCLCRYRFDPSSKQNILIVIDIVIDVWLIAGSVGNWESEMHTLSLWFLL